MSVDEFQRIVRLLANKCWVRYYLHYNGKPELQPMVLEIAAPRGWSTFEALREDLAEKGFTEMPVDDCRGWLLLRWSVPRTDIEPPSLHGVEVIEVKA